MSNNIKFTVYDKETIRIGPDGRIWDMTKNPPVDLTEKAKAMLEENDDPKNQPNYSLEQSFEEIRHLKDECNRHVRESDFWKMRAETAERQLDEALAALKWIEEYSDEKSRHLWPNDLQRLQALNKIAREIRYI